MYYTLKRNDEDENKKWNLTNKLIDLTGKLAADENLDSKSTRYYMTNKNCHLIIVAKSKLYVYSTSDGNFKQISIETNSDTQMHHNIYGISSNTDNLACLTTPYNSLNLVLFADSNGKSLETNLIRVDSFDDLYGSIDLDVFNGILYLRGKKMKIDQTKDEIILYDLNRIIENKIKIDELANDEEKCIILRKSYLNDKPRKIVISNDSTHIAEYESKINVLSLYKRNTNGKEKLLKTGEIQLPCQLIDLCFTSDCNFLVASLIDRRLISFLIVDPSNTDEHNLSLISKLPSR